MLSQPPRLVVIGSSNTDLVLDCPRLPKPGETLLGGEFHRFAGGKGANQAVAAARAGAKVSFIGARGPDEFGKAALAGLRREGITVTHFRVKEGAASGVALILLGGRSKENVIGVARSANDLVTVADVDAAGGIFRKAGAVLAQLETPMAAVQRAAELAGKNGIPIILNPAPARALPEALLKRVHTLTPNEHEVVILAKEAEVEKAAGKLLKRGMENVVVTLGVRGALWVHREGKQYFKAPRVKAVDTVGAGDCFSGWLAVGIAEGMEMPAAIERAVRAAAIAVTRSGAQGGMPWRREVAAR
ncbi:ribokinase [soil metagenome]